MKLKDITENKECLPSKKTLTVKQIAAKHNVSVEKIKKQLTRGIEVEQEHTTNKTLAKEIALDHLKELPDYYTRLDKMENEDTM